MKSIRYDYLGHHPEHIPTIAQWHQNEWFKISPDLNTQLRIDLYSGYDSKPGIPCCIIALVNDKPAGSASLVLSDMDTHPHLSPWVASVFVHTRFRKQGIASRLLELCIENANQAGINRLYLFTPDQTNFYLKRGWKKIESTMYHGELVDIMSFDIDANTL